MQPIIQIQQQFPIYILIILPIATLYCGIFISVSNHYVLKPKIQSFLYKASISSDIVRQLIIDFLSSLSVITYAVSAYLMTEPNDVPLNILAFYDFSWMVGCLPILMYWNIKQEKYCGIMLGKNILMLFLSYICLIYHYISETKLISLPLVLLGIYLINLILNAYEYKFKSFIVELFGLAIEPQVKLLPKCTSKMPSIQFLAQNYPVSYEQLQKKIKTFAQFSDKKKKMQSKLSQQLQTKILVRMKLLQMALSISLSKQKLIQNQKKYVCDYYGQLNGTISYGYNRANLKSSKKLHDKFSSRSIHQANNKILNPSQFHHKKQKQQENMQLVAHKNSIDIPISENQANVAVPQSEGQSPLFYIFPVKIFESSKILSNMFSVFINLGYGLFINYTINVTKTIDLCSYLNFLYAATFLPILPKISAVEYLNTMLLSSIWKYGVIGVFLSISIGLYNENGDGITFNWEYSTNLQYQYFINIAALIISVIMIIGKKGNHKIMAAFSIFLLAVNAGIQYLKHQPLQTNI